MVTLQPGQTLRINVEATDLSVAYLDEAGAGNIEVLIDGEHVLIQPCNQPFIDTDGAHHYLENRCGIRDVPFGRRSVELRAAAAPVTILGLFTYDSRSPQRP